jgi:hypothetical protein
MAIARETCEDWTRTGLKRGHSLGCFGAGDWGAGLVQRNYGISAVIDAEELFTTDTVIEVATRLESSRLLQRLDREAVPHLQRRKERH